LLAVGVAQNLMQDSKLCAPQQRGPLCTQNSKDARLKTLGSAAKGGTVHSKHDNAAQDSKAARLKTLHSAAKVHCTLALVMVLKSCSLLPLEGIAAVSGTGGRGESMRTQ